jgi:hypothetical protein
VMPYSKPYPLVSFVNLLINGTKWHSLLSFK